MYSGRAHHCVLGICIVELSLQIMSNTIGSMSNHYFGLHRITLTSKEPTRFFPRQVVKEPTWFELRTLKRNLKRR